MRLGGPLFGKPETPDQWVEAVRPHGYRATFSPVGRDETADLIEAYMAVARENDILIAETGAWSNPLSSDSTERSAALETCKKGLALAEAIDAGCCVNISGSRGEKWDGPCAEDLTEETFDMIVESVREIIDDVRPTQCLANPIKVFKVGLQPGLIRGPTFRIPGKNSTTGSPTA